MARVSSGSSIRTINAPRQLKNPARPQNPARFVAGRSAMRNIYRGFALSAVMLLLTCLSTSHAAAQYCRPTLAGASDLPEHARAAISKAIGRDQTVYQAQGQPGGFHMQNGSLSADFGQKGASLRFTNGHWTTRALGFGY